MADRSCRSYSIPVEMRRFRFAAPNALQSGSLVYDPTVTHLDPPQRGTRSEPREVAELRALKQRQPDLREAVDMHVELIELHRRVRGRVPLPSFALSADILSQHRAEGRPVLRFEEIPLELTDLRLLVRQVADVLRRYDALDDADYQNVQTLGRDMKLLATVSAWYRRVAEQDAAVAGVSRATAAMTADDSGMLGQVLTLAMRPFLSRCAEVLQQRAELSMWSHPHCALCGGEPDFAVITPSAERHLVCGRCTLQWKFEPLTCPYCGNDDRRSITSFATPDGQYRVYACDVCRRYLKAYDARRATRPFMPMVDSVMTLPLDAAAIQRGYSS
jgi:formate dehydrogenase maturation protein FdhE